MSYLWSEHFPTVRQAREAALDAQLLVLATDLGREKASQLHAEGSAFDPSAFAEHLVRCLICSVSEQIT